MITAYAGFYTGTGSGTRGIDISLRLSNDVLRRTRVYNVNQNWAELNLTYIANISKPTTYYVCKSATTAEKQAEFTVLPWDVGKKPSWRDKREWAFLFSFAFPVF